MKEIKTVHFLNENEFDKKVNEMIKEGYEILSISCGFVNNEYIGFCNAVYQAILIKEV